MIYLLHGENTVSSRSYLLKLKKDFSEVKTISIKSLSSLELSSLTPGSLFSTKVLIVIEGWGKDTAEKIKGLGKERDVVIWTDKIVENPPKEFKVLEFKENFKTNAFRLADAAAERDLKKSLQILADLQNYKIPPELIIGALSREFRLLLATVEKENLSGTPDFVKEKLKKQVLNWNKEEVIKVLNKILELDQRIKTGRVGAFIGLTKLLADLSEL